MVEVRNGGGEFSFGCGSHFDLSFWLSTHYQLTSYIYNTIKGKSPPVFAQKRINFPLRNDSRTVCARRGPSLPPLSPKP